MNDKLIKLKTESRNPKTLNLDTMSTMEIIRVMNEEDQKVIDTIRDALPEIEKSIRIVISALRNEGRLIYTGAGTSGRLGILDAVECVPTFSTADEVVGIIAGGKQALMKAVEGAEDSEELAAKDLDAININQNDVVVAITASGRTPYAIGSLKHAKKHNSKCIGISCNKESVLSEYADISIEVDAGAEILTGSTRLKAGTCQKIILNMISTASMVGIGKVYGNLMVDLRATNYKLVERAKRMVMEITGCDIETAMKALEDTNNSVKVSVLMILTGCTKSEAEDTIDKNQGFLRRALMECRHSKM